jgi:hypothetical protein
VVEPEPTAQIPVNEPLYIVKSEVEIMFEEFFVCYVI